MYAPERTDTTVAVSDFATTNGDRGGSIRKVLVLNGDADSALAALLSSIEALTPDLYKQGVAGNQIAALLDMRKSAYGY